MPSWASPLGRSYYVDYYDANVECFTLEQTNSQCTREAQDLPSNFDFFPVSASLIKGSIIVDGLVYDGQV